MNAIIGQLESLDFTSALVFVINGLKRKELIASNSMILHEPYFDGLGNEGEPDKDLWRHWSAISAAWRDGRLFAAMGKALGCDSGWVITDLFTSRQNTPESMGGRP